MGKEVVSDLYYGQKTVGATAVQIPTAATIDGFKKGTLIKAYGTDDAIANTTPVYIGHANVTVNDGFPLAPGESVVVPYTKSDLYAIAGSANQHVAWISL
jgi:hypothetical protein